jgi:hypothetical protein
VVKAHLSSQSQEEAQQLQLHSVLFGCACIHLKSHVLKWIEVELN